MKLSICMATFKRGEFIAETLDSILAQMVPGVELIVVDGASPDNTPEVMAAYVARHPEIRYIREATNSGVDQDYDKAVGYATGEYCWLMTDDDLLCPGAISRLLSELDGGNDLVIVNQEIRNVDFSMLLAGSRFALSADRQYAAGDRDAMFAETAQGLSFIGCVVIRRSVWMARDRASFYGSLFIHVGVIFQHPPLERVKFIATPMIVIRFGNAMWTARSFEIWMFMWPQLLWAFGNFSAGAKALASAPEPWRNMKQLLLYRAYGGYSMAEYRRFLAPRVRGPYRLLCIAIAICPAALVNILASLYIVLCKRSARMEMYNLATSPHAGWISRFAARRLVV